jgi:hypothetical protein
MTCRNCKRSTPLRGLCLVCRRCTRCGCSCVNCEMCENRTGKPTRHPLSRCQNCGECRRSCGCEKRGAAQQGGGGLLRKGLYPPSGTGFGLLNKSGRAVSIEVELNNYNGLNEMRFKDFTYRVTRDGSVRGSEAEMVCGPMQGDRLVLGLRELATQIGKKRCRADETCGYHVHVDSRDLSWWQVRGVTLLWDRLSPLMYAKVFQPTRQDNRNCLQLQTHPSWRVVRPRLYNPTSTHTLKLDMFRLIFGAAQSRVRYDTKESFATLKHLKHSKYGSAGHDINNLRYYDLNLFSHVYRGTIEFRGMGMSLLQEDIIGWPMVCLGIVQVACTAGGEFVKEATPLEIIGALPEIAREYLTLRVNTIKEGR